MKNDSVMNGNKAIGLQKMEKFIEKVIGVFSDEAEQVLNVIIVEASKVALQAPSMMYDISSVSPQLEGLIKCAFREATAIQDVIETKA